MIFTSPFSHPFTDGAPTLPRLGRLLYLHQPNAYLDIDWDEELGWTEDWRGYKATADDAALFAALGTPFWYATSAADPVARSAAEITAWAGINQYHVLWYNGKLAVYDYLTTPEDTIDKARRVMKQANFDDRPTAFFNGLDTTGQTYTGGPTVVADHLGALNTTQSNAPAIKGARFLDNKLAFSEGFNSWQKINVTVSSNVGSCPLTSNVGTADKVIASAVSGTHVIYESIATDGNVTGSIAVKAAEITKVGFGSQGGLVINAKFNLETGAFISNSGNNVIATNLGDGWWRLSVKNLSGSNVGPYIYLLDASGNGTWTGDGTSGCLVCCGQLNSGPVVKEYIATNGSAQTMFYDTTSDSTQIVASTNQLTRTGSADFSSFTDGTTVKKYSEANPAIMFGQLFEPAHTNYALNSASPATHTTGTIPAGTYTLWQEGSGSIAATAGTAVGTFGTASNGTPATITITTGGTVVLTASGINTWVQLEAGTNKTSRIATTSASFTRQATVASYSTTGKIRANNMAFRVIVTPTISGQSAAILYFLYDANNAFRLHIYSAAIQFLVKVGGTEVSSSAGITHSSNTPLEIICIKTTAGSRVAVRAFAGGVYGSWINTVMNTTATAKANVPIGSTFQVGGGIGVFNGPIHLFDTLFIPEGIPDPLAWAKHECGLPA